MPGFGRAIVRRPKVKEECAEEEDTEKRVEAQSRYTAHNHTRECECMTPASLEAEVENTAMTEEELWLWTEWIGGCLNEARLDIECWSCRSAGILIPPLRRPWTNSDDRI